MSFPHTRLKAPIELPRANVLGVGVHAVTPLGAVELLADAVANGGKGYVCVTGVHGVMEAQRSDSFRRALDQAWLVLPDGMPTVWLGKLQGCAMDRVFGPDLMWNLCGRSVPCGTTHYLYGGRPGVVTTLRLVLERCFPGIRVVGTVTPPFRPLTRDEEAGFIDEVSRLRPDVIWVGLSTPKQEKFMAEMIDRLDCKLMIGVGAAFDIHTGNLKDAPEWIKRLGVQWLHRLYQEPRRLWKRYLVNNSAFLWSVALQLTGLRRYELSPATARLESLPEVGLESRMAD